MVTRFLASAAVAVGAFVGLHVGVASAAVVNPQIGSTVNATAEQLPLFECVQVDRWKCTDVNGDTWWLD